jgi:hypothetical protein
MSESFVLVREAAVRNLGPEATQAEVAAEVDRLMGWFFG